MYLQASHTPEPQLLMDLVHCLDDRSALVSYANPGSHGRHTPSQFRIIIWDHFNPLMRYNLSYHGT